VDWVVVAVLAIFVGTIVHVVREAEAHDR